MGRGSLCGGRYIDDLPLGGCEMKVKIGFDYLFAGLSFYLYQEKDGKKYLVKPVDLVLQELPHDHFTPVDSTIKLSGYESDEFLKSLAEELDRMGVKTDSDFKIKGLLEAKEKHLQDMRRIVFERNKK